MRLHSLGSRAKNFATVRALTSPGDNGHAPGNEECSEIIAVRRMEGQ